MNILDIAMNSLAANAKKVEISVRESRKHDRLVLRVRDDGRGMDTATLDRLLRSRGTTKTSRKKKIGLGLAFLQQTSEMCDGQFHVRSAPGRGTTVTASMRESHIDRPPLGDLNATILTLCAANPDVEVQLNYRSDEQALRFSSRELVSKRKVCV